MKLIILKDNLIEALNSVEKIISFGSTLPILKNILIKTGDNKIILIATDLELAVIHVILGKVIEKGEIIIPFNIFNGIIKNINTEKINLELKEKQLLINTDNYEAIIQVQESKDYPIIPTISDNKSIKIKNSYLRNILNNVIIATRYSDIRPEISGIFLNCTGDNLIFAATDSFRLTERIVGFDKIETNLSETGVIIPIKTIEEVLRIFKNLEEEIEIFIEPTQILFKSKDKQLISRLIDGKFPDYKSIIPKDFKHEILINRQEFINSLKLTSSFSGKASEINLKIGENKKILEIYSVSSDIGENRYKLPIKNLKGGGFSLSFNWHYLLDGLKIYESEEVVFGINSIDQPAVIKNPNQPNLIYVVMPLKV